MAYAYEILADMAIDIDPQTAEKYGLKYIPMEYTLGPETFTLTKPADTETMMDFYQQLRNKVTTQTFQINPYTYVTALKPYAEAGRPLLYISLSSGLSNTYSSALAAVDILKNEIPGTEIEVVDSLAATVGMGLLAESALLNREEGMSLKDNAGWLRSRTNNVLHQFKVTDLFYLMRGGRISAPAATMGTALNLKPVLIINKEGKLETAARKRGDHQAHKYIVSRYEELHDGSIDPRLADTAYICHAGCPEVAETLKASLLAVHPQLTIHTCMLSPVIGAHTGPDMVALVFYGRI